MKVERADELRPPEPPKQPFGEVLRTSKPPAHVAAPKTPAKPLQAGHPPPKSTAPAKPPAPTVKNAAANSAVAPRAPVASATSAATHAAIAPATQQLARARRHVDGEAQRLDVVRSDHAHAATSMTHARTERGEQLDEQQTAKLADALNREFSKETPPPPLAPAMKLEPVQTGAPAKTDAPPETRAAQATALIEKIEHFVRSNRPGLSLTLNNSLGARVELERLGPKALSVKLYGKPGAEAVSRIREELRARGLDAKLTVI